MEALYDFRFEKNDGMTQFMHDYRGKVILIVNIATACGFTPQLGELEFLYKKYSQQGLVVLGFPCNQFGGQNPENGEDTADFCKINYGVSFPIFCKIEVNGANAAPLYTYLKSVAGFDANTAFPNGIMEILKKTDRTI